MPTDPMRTQRKRAMITLPAPLSQGGTPLWEAISARRSVHTLVQVEVSLAELAQLAWAAQGVTALALDPPRRAAPSAGATYPLETYVAAQSVAELEPGTIAMTPWRMGFALRATQTHSRR